MISNPEINWRESSLQTDQDIVECLFNTLGRPVGYGENAMGGYDPNGDSHLVIITKDGDVSVEQQIADAIASDDHNWIVFDKDDFASASEIGLYRLGCTDADMLANLGTTDVNLCLNYRDWCGANNVGESDCLQEFFNVRLNDKDLSFRNPLVGSNTTVDGRGAKPVFLFSGFSLGSADGEDPTATAVSVIMTHLMFQGAGHDEDHGLDPDMIRSTGASHDIWIHKNMFDTTGDSAFDVKVGAYNITVSFNLLRNVKRAALHGSSDSREINAQITTTIHNNAFITTDDYYSYFGDGARRVPLARRGASHMFNNVFYGYRKDILSVRVGARILFEDNAFLNVSTNPEDDDIEYLVENLLRDFQEGGLEIKGSRVWLSNSSCVVDDAASGDLTASHGSTPDMMADYSVASQNVITSNRQSAGQALVDYVLATAGPAGALPFNSSLASSQDSIIAQPRRACQ
ncbi:MAG: hypothetical protein JXX14_11850 [Deltaproteobacteria bacterium]|nr:hypothetical protein [Deltaproteobacteria bacterium]